MTEEYMKERIYEIRGQRVILDSDLSEIYGYTTKAFKQRVKNILRNLMKILCSNEKSLLFEETFFIMKVMMADW